MIKIFHAEFFYPYFSSNEQYNSSHSYAKIVLVITQIDKMCMFTQVTAVIVCLKTARWQQMQTCAF